jgi:hypothetical protein
MADRRQMTKVVDYTSVLVCLFSASLALVVLLSYGAEAIVELPTGYLEPGSTANVVGQVFFISKMVLVFAVILYPIVNELAGALQKQYVKRWVAPAAARRQVAVPDLRLAEASKHRFSGPELSPQEETWVAAEKRLSTMTLVEDPPVASMPMLGRLVVGLSVTGLSILAGELVPSLSFIISLTGAVFAVSLAYTLPSLVFLIVMPFADHPVTNVAATLMVMFGLCSSGLALYAIV